MSASPDTIAWTGGSPPALRYAKQTGMLVAGLFASYWVLSLIGDCGFGDMPLRIVGGLTTGSIYSLIALGYTLVYGVLRLINFAHSEVFMGSTFGALVLLQVLVGEGESGTWFYLMLAAVPAVVVGALLAVILERSAYRPLRRRGDRKSVV